MTEIMWHSHETKPNFSKILHRAGVRFLVVSALYSRWSNTSWLHGTVNVGVSAERAYPAGCSRRDASYYDYENTSLIPPWVIVRSTDDYLLTRRLGTGKFSDVFEAVDVEKEQRLLQQEPYYCKSRTTRTSTTSTHSISDSSIATVDPRTVCVIKCLKPVSERKIRREILVLHRCGHLLNLARLEAVVIDDPKTTEAGGHKAADDFHLPRMPSLVLEHAGPGSQWLCHGQSPTTNAGQANNCDYYLSDYEIRYYLYHLLLAIDGLHSVGIMHRDIKPRNVLVNRLRSSGRAPLMLIDLGLADFYLPGVSYNVRVASRHYKSPELLVGYELYDYAIDLWGVGCILAGLLLRREPFFRGKDNIDQLGKILAVLGTDELLAFLVKYNVQVTTDVEQEILKYHTQQQQQQQQHRDGIPQYHNKRQALLDCRATDCPIPNREGMDLLEKLLVYDHEARLTAQQAMQHPFFDIVQERVLAEVRSHRHNHHASR